MRIAIDLDKTYEASPHFFDGIASRFKQAGHEVGILTVRHLNEGCHVTFEPDFVIFLDKGELSYAERGKHKALSMKQHQIDILFDDRANYIPSEVIALKII